MRIWQIQSRCGPGTQRKRTHDVGAMPIGLLLGLWLMVPSSPSFAQVIKIVAGGDATPIGGVFATDGTPALTLGVAGPHNMRAIAFLADITEGSSHKGLFFTQGKTMTKVVAAGDPTPLGGTFLAFSPPAQNQAGDIAFSALIKGGDAAQGVFLFSGGQLTTVAEFSAASPLKELAPYAIVPALNDNRDVAFRGLLPETGKDTPGIFRSTPSGIETLVADEHPSAAGPRLSIDVEDTSPLAFNNAGSIALNTVAKDGEDIPGIFVVSHTGALEKSVSIGDPTPVGGTFSAFLRPSLNNAGDVVFQATIADGTASQGIFLVKQGQVSLVVAEGDPTSTGGRFALKSFVAPPLVNDRGEVAFNASVMKEENVSVMGTFLFSQGQIQKAMVAGDPSPLGGTFLEGPVVSQLSNTGTIVFVGIVDTDGDGNPNNQGIFFVQPFSF